MRAFALGRQIVFDQAVELGKRLVVVFRRAVVWIRALQGMCKDANRSVEILASIRGKERGKLVMELRKQHSMVLVHNFLVSQR